MPSFSITSTAAIAAFIFAIAVSPGCGSLASMVVSVSPWREDRVHDMSYSIQECMAEGRADRLDGRAAGEA
jgi:hypothetical protein